MRRAAVLPAFCLLALLPAAGPARADSQEFTVTKTADTNDGTCDADCSLREAIGAANTAAGFDFIRFAIPSEGSPVTLTPTSPLPAITSPVLIDGETQLGASCGGLVLAVDLDGSAAGAGANGLAVAAADSVVRGLAIHGFAGHGIDVSATGVTITCNRIGTDVTGAVADGNVEGVHVTAANAEIGGPAASDGNEIAASQGAGVHVIGTSGTHVRSNVIGEAQAGATEFDNAGSAVFLEDSTDSLIGGEGAGNVIRGNDGGGVWIFGNGSLRNRVSRNAMVNDGGEGIDLLGADFEDPIDPGDADSGPNNLQNSPAIASAILAGGGDLTVAYRVDSDPANAAYPLTVEFFRTDDDDEGSAFLGSATFSETDWQSGTPVDATFTPAATIAAQDHLLATATDADGNTSEFPAFVTVVPEADATLASAAALAVVGGLTRLRSRRDPSCSGACSAEG